MSPAPLDRDTLRRHLLALDEALSNLQLHTGETADRLREDLDERWAVERGLQLCVQNVLDIATHLVASAGRDAPDYTSAIDELGNLGVVPLQLAKDLRPLAGFRNALVHGYLRIDLDRVHSVLNDHLDQMRQFARHIDEHMRAQPS